MHASISLVMQVLLVSIFIELSDELLSLQSSELSWNSWIHVCNTDMRRDDDRRDTALGTG